MTQLIVTERELAKLAMADLITEFVELLKTVDVFVSRANVNVVKLGNVTKLTAYRPVGGATTSRNKELVAILRIDRYTSEVLDFEVLGELVVLIQKTEED